MIDIAEILKDAPKGIKLYSPIFGECTFCVMTANRICVYDLSESLRIFDSYGRYCVEGECALFPSKNQLSWEKFSI